MASIRIKTFTGFGTLLWLNLGLSFVFSQPTEGQTTNVSATGQSPTTPAAVSTNANSSPAQLSFVPADGLTAETILKKAKATYAALQSYSDIGTVVSQMGPFSFTTNFKTRLQRPGFYLIEWQKAWQPLMHADKGTAWSDGTGDYLDYTAEGPKKQQSREMALAGATGISSGAAATIPASFFGETWGDKLSGKYQRETDDKITEIDCYVVSRVIKAREKTFSTTLWIGKQDNLIHQIKSVTTGMSIAPPLDDSTLQKILIDRKTPVTAESMAELRKQMTATQEQAQNALKNIESLETHSNIVTDKTFAPADFKPAAN